MNTSFFRHTLAVLIISILSSLALVSCGGSSNLDGVYHGMPGSPITITLKSGKATVQVANESKTLGYKVEGNKLTILDPKEGNIVLTINDDGTLNSELGVMSKKPM